MLKAIFRFVLPAAPAETSSGQLPVTTGPAETETAPVGTEAGVAPTGPAETETILVYSTPLADTSGGSSPVTTSAP
ncbi:hypothetical protein THARTR1_01108 [Trichoderma harzianum]|uniref:Uncharacterized protein n=1 Tax=Trichoderma harzianum TaxID=5544 RepID=A0A2K0UM49_TRIHA|nr:hypothetical protein THARTR1_01108 [Trichoderma harzianum]